MYGSDHYRMAEEYLDDAGKARAKCRDDEAAQLLGFARVHALLAQAASTAPRSGPTGDAWAEAFDAPLSKAE